MYQYDIIFRLTPHVTGQVDVKVDFRGVPVHDFAYKAHARYARMDRFRTDVDLETLSFADLLVHIRTVASEILDLAGPGIGARLTYVAYHSTSKNGKPPWDYDAVGGSILLEIDDVGWKDRIVYDCGATVQYYIEIEFNEL